MAASNLDGRLLCACNVASAATKSGAIPIHTPFCAEAEFLEAPMAFVDVSEPGTACLVGHIREGVVVAFGGTHPIDNPAKPFPQRLWNWVNDANAALVANANLPGHVHSGFLQAVNSLWGLARSEVDRQMALPGVPKKLFITGYSNGGGMAPLAAMRCLTESRIAPAVITFAAPRSGNSEFAAAFDQQLHMTRYEFAEDIVPNLPPDARLIEIIDRATGLKIPHLEYASVGQLHYFASTAAGDSPAVVVSPRLGDLEATELDVARLYRLVKLIREQNLDQIVSDHKIDSGSGYWRSVGLTGVQAETVPVPTPLQQKPAATAAVTTPLEQIPSMVVIDTPPQNAKQPAAATAEALAGVQGASSQIQMGVKPDYIGAQSESMPSKTEPSTRRRKGELWFAAGILAIGIIAGFLFASFGLDKIRGRAAGAKPTFQAMAADELNEHLGWSDVLNRMATTLKDLKDAARLPATSEYTAISSTNAIPPDKLVRQAQDLAAELSGKANKAATDATAANQAVTEAIAAGKPASEVEQKKADAFSKNQAATAAKTYADAATAMVNQAKAANQEITQKVTNAAALVKQPELKLVSVTKVWDFDSTNNFVGWPSDKALAVGKSKTIQIDLAFPTGGLATLDNIRARLTPNDGTDPPTELLPLPAVCLCGTDGTAEKSKGKLEMSGLRDVKQKLLPDGKYKLELFVLSSSGTAGTTPAAPTKESVADPKSTNAPQADNSQNAGQSGLSKTASEPSPGTDAKTPVAAQSKNAAAKANPNSGASPVAKPTEPEKGADAPTKPDSGAPAPPAPRSEPSGQTPVSTASVQIQGSIIITLGTASGALPQQSGRKTGPAPGNAASALALSTNSADREGKPRPPKSDAIRTSARATPLNRRSGARE